jgi:hypothetical protein
VNKQPDNVTTAERDRRDTVRRARVVRSVLEEVVHNAVPFITIQTIQDALDVSPEAAMRIVERLVSAGLLIETQAGTWIKVSP